MLKGFQVRLGLTIIGLSLFCVPLTLSVAKASTLFAPFSLDSAAVLPKGVRGFSVTTFSTEITQRLDGYGNSVPLAAAFNKSIKWNDLVKAQPAGFERESLAGYIESKGISLDSSVGDSSAVINTRLTTSVPVLAYGLTEKATIALAVPIIYSNMNVSTGWTANQEFNAAIQKFSADGKAYKISQNRAKLSNVIVSELQSKGYKPLVNEQHSDVGDLNLVGKYQILKSDDLTLAVATKVVAPTGRAADVDKLVDVGASAGVWNAGLTGVADYKLAAGYTLTGSAAYTYQLSSQLQKRVPAAPDNSSSADIDPATNVQLGSIYSAATALKYNFARLWTVATGFNFQYKGADQYSGGLYSSERYNYLAIDSEQTLTAAQLMGTFSTVPLYMSQQFAAPLEGSIGYSRVLAGKNVADVDLVTAQLAMFF